MGHYCWVCGRTRANERFSGKGHARHICKECQQLPREDRDRVQALRDIDAYTDQRNISAKNKSRLKTLCRSSSEEVRQKAQLVLEVARAAPHKRKRRAVLARQSPELLNRLIEQGLILGYLTGPEAELTVEDDGTQETGEDAMF
jgi:hypothetical protein